MSRTSLQSKTATARPGLAAYSFYRSDRRQVGRQQAKPSRRPRPRLRQLLLAALIGLAVIIGVETAGFGGNSSSTGSVTTPGSPAAVKAATATACSNNDLPKFVVVNISQRHMWACQAKHEIYDSPVVTGMANLVADLTPTGTYQVYAKQTNLTLTGSDTTGSWSDPVNYWMPFLQNQYGTYGFHDATWRPDSAFGNISPASSDASHGCVELPLATAKWLYSWIDVGTSVTIQS